MKKFSKEEIEYLEKHKWHKLSDSYFSRKSMHDDGSDYYMLWIDKNGEIIYTSSYPINVDPDWGTCDRAHETLKYKTFEDYINNKPFFNKRDIS